MKHKLSQWHDGSVKPVHVGVYKTECGYQHWNGKFWGFFMPTVKYALQFRDEPSKCYAPAWRGILK